jgi:GntR family transcriptional regulator
MESKRAEIIDYLLVQMIEDVLKSGDKLPAESDMSERFRTTRINVRKAMERLIEMGYIEFQKNKGYFVKPKRKKLDLTMNGNESFSMKMKAMFMDYKSMNLGCEVIPYNQRIWTRLGIDKEQHVYQISRLRWIQNEPIALHVSYVSDYVFKSISSEGHDIESMFDYYISQGHRAFTSRQSILSISFPTLAEQKLFQCSGLIPLLMVETDCVDQVTGQVLEMTKILYKGDSFKYTMG